MPGLNLCNSCRLVTGYAYSLLHISLPVTWNARNMEHLPPSWMLGKNQRERENA